MKLIDAAEVPIVFNSETTISKVISKLEKERKTEAIVSDGNSYLGIISVDSLIQKNIQDPDRTKLANLKSVIERVEPFTDDITLEEAVNAILINNYKSIPVYKNGKIQMLTKLSLLKFLPKSILKGKKATDVMTFPDIISADDTLSVAKSIARDSHSNRVVILDKNSVAGILDSFGLLSSTITKTRSKRGEVSGEKISLGKVSAKSKFSTEDFITVDEDKQLSQIVDEMVKSNKNTVIVGKNKLSGLITPRHILKLVSSEISGVYVQTMGFQEEDEFLKSVVDGEITREIKILSNIVKIDYMTLHLDKYNKTGKRTKFSVHGKLITNKGMFFAQDHSWDLTQAVRGVLKKMDKEVKKRKGKLDRRDSDHARYK